MTIICGIKWGIIGILTGKIVSLLTIVVLWKPYYLFSAGFKKTVWHYWKNVLRNYAISSISIVTAIYFTHYIPLNPYKSIGEWAAYAVLSMLIFLSINLSATILFAKGAKDSLRRIVKK